MKYLVFLFALLHLGALPAQQSSKSKSKDRFRERDVRSSPVRIQNANEINQEGSDTAPAFFKQGIVFVSGLASSDQRGAKAGEAYTALYYAFFNSNGEPSFPQKTTFLPEKKSNFNAGPVCFSRDNQTAFHTLPNNEDGVLKPGKTGKTALKIYESRYDKSNWTKPSELPFNNDEYSCIHPSLSADGARLFFASDMPGGYGGYDIYTVEHKEAGWSVPVNLGPLVNTEKQEIFPFIATSGVLFFSSNGRSNSLGGFDNYYVNNPLDNPEEVVNLGEDFNSNADDLSFILDDEGESGFFSSNRARGAGKDDIYRFEAPHGLEGAGKAQRFLATISVSDATTGQALQKADIRILQVSEDGFTNNTNDFYTVDLAPAQDKSNALNLQLTRRGADDLGQPDYFSNAEGKAQVELTRFQTYLVVVSLPGYSPKERLVSVETESVTPLQFKLSVAPPCFKAGGMVATQAFGTRIWNATVKFVHRASGQAVTANTNKNGEYDTCLPLEGEYVVYVGCPGFGEATFRLDAAKDTPAFTETRLETLDANAEAAMPLANSLQPGSTIILGQVFTENNSATLYKDGEIYLDALYDLLQQYPDMEIDLAVHTDTRGDTRLNRELTEARALKAKNYLLSRGIAAGRITATGKGESEPRNRCAEGVNCTEEEHAQNNRVEVKVRKVR